MGKAITRDDMRHKFECNWGKSYKAITKKEIQTLRKILKSKLAVFENEDHKMALTSASAYQNVYDKSGSVVNYSFRVSSTWFDNREAITFNSNGFIGFAGWADNTNIKPFLEAFNEWIDLED